MKKNIKGTIILLALGLILASCEEYLSEFPDNRTVIDSKAKVDALLTNAYPIGNYMRFAELMSDNAQFKSVVAGVPDPNILEVVTWDTSSAITQDSYVGYWNGCYKAIAQANQALASIKELGEAEMTVQKGEALLARAYAHFMLVNFWGKHYNPASASTDLGVPYVLEPETVLIKKYKRNTVQEVYDLVEKDMLEGLELVEARDNNPKYHFSKASGYALATRFYTFKGEWSKVVEYASKVITDPRNEIRNQLEYRELTYDQQVQRYPSSFERTNLLVVETSSWWARNFFTYRYGMAEGNFLDTNHPLGKQWAYPTFRSGGQLLIPKFDEYFHFTNISAGIGLGYTPIVLFSKDEVLLNRAEAYAMLEQYDMALQDMTDFLSQKTIGFLATDNLTETNITNTFPAENENLVLTPPYSFADDKQISFVRAILDFKQKVFLFEGFRWFDVRRFGIEIKRPLRNGTVVDTIVLTKNDNRKQLQLPETAIENELTPNPR